MAIGKTSFVNVPTQDLLRQTRGHIAEKILKFCGKNKLLHNQSQKLPPFCLFFLPSNSTLQDKCWPSTPYLFCIMHSSDINSSGVYVEHTPKSQGNHIPKHINSHFQLTLMYLQIVMDIPDSTKNQSIVL